ncbi:MAG: spore cortex biosynthesis protein YabQ [Firmicutes bacterium]|nr:spore cortex biosynthesis protein YabQ [Bacillota bacterium]
MTGTVESQLVGLAVTMVAGVIAGALFDLYRVARWAMRPGKVFTAISDVVFWLFAATMVFRFLLAYSWGEVRFYMLVGFAAGFAVYRAVMGRRVVGGAVSTYEYAQHAGRTIALGFREGTLGLRRASSRWRKGCRKTYACLGTLWANIKRKLCFSRKES